jgi:hypothetical protein
VQAGKVRRMERAEHPEGGARSGAADERPAALLPANEGTDFRHRSDTIQTGFVDEPRRAVEDADSLVTQTMKRAASHAERRGRVHPLSPARSRVPGPRFAANAPLETRIVDRTPGRSTMRPLLILVSATVMCVPIAAFADSRTPPTPPPGVEHHIPFEPPPAERPPVHVPPLQVPPSDPPDFECPVEHEDCPLHE